MNQRLENTAFAPSWLAVRGLRTAYRRSGTGEPLLYLHGAGLTRRWLPVHAALAERFDLMAPEHPGFGDTLRPRWFRGLGDVVLHYADLLDALELPSVHLVGHSLGGRIAGAFASVYPERVRSLTLVAPAPLCPGGAEDDGHDDDDDTAVDVDELLFNGHQERYPAFLNGDDDGLRVLDDADPHADPARWTLDAPATLYRRLARVGCPSQVLIPDEDRLIPEEMFEEWASYLAGAAVVRINGGGVPTGHLLVVQEPEAITREVVRLAALSRR